MYLKKTNLLINEKMPLIFIHGEVVFGEHGIFVVVKTAERNSSVCLKLKF